MELVMDFSQGALLEEIPGWLPGGISEEFSEKNKLGTNNPPKNDDTSGEFLGRIDARFPQRIPEVFSDKSSGRLPQSILGVFPE